MARPKRDKYYQYNPYKSDTGLARYSKAQDKCIDDLQSENKELVEALKGAHKALVNNNRTEAARILLRARNYNHL